MCYVAGVSKRQGAAENMQNAGGNRVPDVGCAPVASGAAPAAHIAALQKQQDMQPSGVAAPTLQHAEGGKPPAAGGSPALRQPSKATHMQEAKGALPVLGMTLLNCPSLTFPAMVAHQRMSVVSGMGAGTRQVPITLTRLSGAFACKQQMKP